MMQKLVAGISLACTTAGHPFVGENLDARYVSHDNAKFSNRLHPQSTSTLSSFKYKTSTIKTKKPLKKQINELVFGQSYEDRKF